MNPRLRPPIKNYYIVLRRSDGLPIESISEKSKTVYLRLFENRKDVDMFLLSIGWSPSCELFEVITLEEALQRQHKIRDITFEKQMDNLVKSGALLSWYYSHDFNTIHFEVPEIIIHYNKLEYTLGPYSVSFPLSDSHVLYNIKVQKIPNSLYDRNVNSRSIHPHINDKGDMCFGNMGTIINKSIMDRNYYAIVIIILEVLRSYSHYNCFSRIENFPFHYQK